MGMVKALAFASLALLAGTLGGCKDITKDAQGLAERACACHDKACADRVVDDLVDLFKSNPHAASDEAKMQEAGKKLGTCAVTAGASVDEITAKLKPFTE